MEIKLKRKLTIFLIIVTIIAVASIPFVSSLDELDISPIDVDFVGADTWNQPLEELLPCTNQRYKAWFGCS